MHDSLGVDHENPRAVRLLFQDARKVSRSAELLQELRMEPQHKLLISNIMAATSAGMQEYQGSFAEASFDSKYHLQEDAMS